jgi:magnesium transporter
MNKSQRLPRKAPEMKADNPLSQEFLLRYPVEAARTLEQVSAEDVAGLFNELSTETITPVLIAMLPDMAVTCLAKMQGLPAAKLLTALPVNRAARIYRLLPSDKQKELAGSLPDKTRNRIHRFLNYASLSAGDLMDPNVTLLPDNLTVADAIRRIERHRQSISCEIYLVNELHQLQGVMDLGKLLISDHHARLRDIMNRAVRPVSAYASAAKLLSHPAWAGRHRLPVVERDNTLVGTIGHTRLLEATGEESVTTYDPLENLLSLAGLYWLSVTQLLDIFFNTGNSRKGERR